MKNIKEKNIIRNRDGVYEWIKYKIYQIVGIILILFALFLYFSLYFFEFQDYGNPYLSTPKENIKLFFIIGSWFNGVTAYWTGKAGWILPLFPFISGYRIFNNEKIKYFFMKTIIIFIGILLIAGGLKNLGQDGGQLSLLTSKLYFYLEQIINIDSKKFIISISGIIIGIFLFLGSLDIKFKIYNILLRVLFKSGSFLIKNVFQNFYIYTKKLTEIFIHKNKISKKLKVSKKSFSKKKMPNLGYRAEKEKQKELELDLEENTIFALPHLELLSEPARRKEYKNNEEQLENTARMLENVLDDFGIRGEIGRIQSGPVVTRYELEPAPGVRSSRVIGLSDDIARSMSAVSARVAVVPGRNAIGIELPNEDREVVFLRELLSSKAFEEKNDLPLALGRDIAGSPIVTDLAKMPHLLVAGTTGSGKSVAVNAMIISLLYTLSPNKLKFIMIDPKMLELSVYEDIPHLLHPVVTEPRKAVVALKWAVQEMNNRYRLMSELGVRSIHSYNGKIIKTKEKGQILTKSFQTGFDPNSGKPIIEKHELASEILPNIVIVIDEMADLMLSSGRDIEMSIQALAQKARAAGIHLIVATQRPSVDVITGTIKANLPTRISFQVTSKIDSRTILGEQGAEQLLGKGDMLFMESASQVQRIHGPFVSDQEVDKVASFLRSKGSPDYVFEITQDNEDSDVEPGQTKTKDPLFDQAVELVSREQKASTSFLQRHLQIGYNRAARIIDIMEAENMISPASQTGKREVLLNKR
ncbi:MAG: DNA translocase FtsK 4TM domain-containing protein [Alphaproteobacteria bacterium]|nr:DNA translocase FtsK 4TM domain-containing protein [Alphaproteobacteria bacterium]